MGGEPGGFELRHLAEQDLADERIFVAQIDVDRPRLDRPRGDEHAFEKAVRVALEVVAVLERPRLALVRVHRHQPRTFIAAYDAPLPSGREPGPAQTAQAGGVELRGDVLELVLAREAVAQQRVAALLPIGIEGAVLGNDRMEIAGLDDVPNRGLVHMVEVAVSDFGHRGGVAPAHARRADDPDALTEGGGQRLQQGAGAGQLARKAVADPNRDRRRRLLAFGEHVEVGVERRDLVDLRHRQTHLVSQRGEVRRGDAVPGVLYQVQVLDEQVAVAGTIAEQLADFVEGSRIDLPALRLAAGLAAAGAGMAASVRWFDVGGHSDSDGDCRFRRIGGDCPG